MRYLLPFLTALLLITPSTAQDVIRLSEPVQQTESYEVFGSELDVESLQPKTLSQIIGGKEKGVTLVTVVKQVCAKKGCFFIAQDEEYSARITFKDYGFFIPTDSQGKEVILVGDLSVTTLSEEQAKHYAEDAGEDPDDVKGAQKEYSVVATSIIVPKTK